jgi:hypothetical protein
MGRDAHLREECATTMKNLVSDALQFDKENITYPKIGKEDVSILLSFYRKISLFIFRFMQLYVVRWM